MKLRSLAGLVAVAALLALAPAAVAGPSVTVRVEGAAGTLLERTRVTLPDTPVAGCGPNTVAAAIEVATGGNWDRQPFTQTILGETHAFADSDYWAEWVDRGSGYKFGGGICNDVLAEGNEVLMLVDRSPPPDFRPTVFPLDVESVPAQAMRGAEVTVTVVEYRLPTGATGEGERTPVAGATVTAGAASATTGADGRATLTLSATGTIAVKATRPGNAPSAAELVSVSDRAGAPPPVTTTGRDTVAPLARIVGIRDGQRFSRRRAPRELRGTVADDPSGLRAVKLRLSRRVGKRCWYFSGKRERFLRRACGTRHAFKIGDDASWRYLLPKRLGRGRYMLDVYAIDRAGNRDVAERGRSRVVFFVR
jgi:hypothetical protein